MIVNAHLKPSESAELFIIIIIIIDSFIWSMFSNKQTKIVPNISHTHSLYSIQQNSARINENEPCFVFFFHFLNVDFIQIQTKKYIQSNSTFFSFFFFFFFFLISFILIFLFIFH